MFNLQVLDVDLLQIQIECCYKQCVLVFRYIFLMSVNVSIKIENQTLLCETKSETFELHKKQQLH